jgi:glycosyltransferase involved in cell wall biosynthesis
LRTDKPIAFWTDISFAGMVGYYPEFNNLTARSIREGNRAEQSALSRCAAAIYSSEWARQLTIDHYDVDPAKVHVLPFGANITEAPTRAEVERMVTARSREKCTLLFLAGAWTRKGGDKAFAVTEALNAGGVPTELVVCGGQPSPEALASPHVTYLGYVSKGTPEGLAQWTAMLAGAHFYVLPSFAETFGAATCEANAYGLPGLVNDVGGTAGAVTNGVNGQLFDADASPEVWRDYVRDLWSDPAKYAALALSSADEYAGRLNWETGCRAVIDILQKA